MQKWFLLGPHWGTAMVCGLGAVWAVRNRTHCGLGFGGKVCPQLRFLAQSIHDYVTFLS